VRDPVTVDERDMVASLYSREKEKEREKREKLEILLLVVQPL